MKKINVLFRACDKVLAYNRAARPFGLDKTTLDKICFLSLYESIKEFPHSIHVMGDDLSEDLRNFFSRFPVTISHSVMGNEESIRQCIKHALTLPDDELVYFCEDDYLHRPETFARVHACLERISSLAAEPDFKRSSFSRKYRIDKDPVVLFPPDYPDRYAVNNLEQSFIIQTADCHWRQVRNVTFTLLTEVRCVKKYHEIFEKSSVGARDGLLSRKLFADRRILCLSPIPGLTTHMHDGCMTPFVSWQELVERLKQSLVKHEM